VRKLFGDAATEEEAGELGLMVVLKGHAPRQIFAREPHERLVLKARGF